MSVTSGSIAGMPCGLPAKCDACQYASVLLLGKRAVRCASVLRLDSLEQASAVCHVRSVRRHVPEDADLVVLEFALNDKNASKPWCGMEAPVRCAYGQDHRETLHHATSLRS